HSPARGQSRGPGLRSGRKRTHPVLRGRRDACAARVKTGSGARPGPRNRRTSAASLNLEKTKAPMSRLDVKILDPRLYDQPPQYATEGAAGLDLRACIEGPVELLPGASVLVPSGIAIHLADKGLAA